MSLRWICTCARWMGLRPPVRSWSKPRPPIVIVSASTSIKEVASTFRAMDAGALAVVLRPPGIGSHEHPGAARELIQTVKMMSEIKVIRRFTRAARDLKAGDRGQDDQNRNRAANTALAEQTRRGDAQRSTAEKSAKVYRVIAIGASTGGPPVLEKILFELPADLSVPVLIVQHITPGFVNGFVEWLCNTTRFPVHVAVHGQPALPGHAYVAPDKRHMGIDSSLRIALNTSAPENGLQPSVSYLFRSVAQVLGAQAIGVLLTGMGSDGAAGLKLMRQSGAITIAQDEATSVVHGMPGEAIKLGAATYILPSDLMASSLASLVRKSGGAK